MKIEVEIDVNLPEEYDAAGAEYRPVIHKECYLNGDNQVMTWFAEQPSSCKYIVLQKTWQPAPWMPKGTILHYIGDWVFERHQLDGSRKCILAELLAEIYFEKFDPPPQTERKYLVS